MEGELGTVLILGVAAGYLIPRLPYGPASDGVPKIQNADRIVQRIGRIEKAGAGVSALQLKRQDKFDLPL